MQSLRGRQYVARLEKIIINFILFSGCGKFCFTAEPLDVSVFSGGSTVLQCSASPAATLSWRHAPVQPLDEVPLLDLKHDPQR